MPDETSPDDPQTPEALIARTVNTLREADGTDVELLDILSEHVLTVTPSKTDLSDAVSAIETLAAERAETPDNGTANHD